jgi:predicted DNA-binding protein (MmcQ/YjbR family)
MRPKGRLAAALKKAASKHPGAEESIACEGTAIEATTWGVGKKVFLFAGVSKGVVSIRVRLAGSAGEAKRLAKAEPRRYAFGATGWATVKFSEAEKPPMDLLERWISESWSLVT